jgi:hypothetical protein
MPRHEQSSNPAGERATSRGKRNPSERETDETRRLTRGSANRMTDHDTDQSRAPGAPIAQRQRRMDQRTSEPLSQLDSLGSPSTSRGTPAASRRKAGVSQGDTAAQLIRHSATTDDDDIGDFSSQEASRRVSAQGKRPAAPLEALPEPKLLHGGQLTNEEHKLARFPRTTRPSCLHFPGTEAREACLLVKSIRLPWI